VVKPEESLNDKLDPAIHDAFESTFVYWQKQPGYSVQSLRIKISLNACSYIVFSLQR